MPQRANSQLPPQAPDPSEHTPTPLGTFLSPWGVPCTEFPSASNVQAWIRSLGPRTAHWSVYDPATHPLGDGWGAPFQDRSFVNGSLKLLYSDASSPTSGLLDFIGRQLMVNIDLGEQAAVLNWLSRALIRAWSRYDRNSDTFKSTQVADAKYGAINNDVDSISTAVERSNVSCDLFVNGDVYQRYDVVVENRPFNPAMSDNSDLSSQHPLMQLLWHEGAYQSIVRLLLMLPPEPPSRPAFVWPLNWWTVNYPADIASFECQIPASFFAEFANNEDEDAASGPSVPLVAIPTTLRARLTELTDQLRNSANALERGQAFIRLDLGDALGLVGMLLQYLVLDGRAMAVKAALRDMADWLDLAAHPDAALNDTLAFVGTGLNNFFSLLLDAIPGDSSVRQSLANARKQFFGDLSADERAALCLSLNTRGPSERRFISANAGPEELRAFELRLDVLLGQPANEDIVPIFHTKATSWKFNDFDAWDAQFITRYLDEWIPDPNGRPGDPERSIRTWLTQASPTIQLAECLESARVLLKLGLQADQIVFAADPVLCGQGSVPELARSALRGIGWDCLGELTHGHGLGELITGVWRQLIADMFYGVMLARVAEADRDGLRACLDEIFCWHLTPLAREDIDAVLGTPDSEFDWSGEISTNPPGWRDFSSGLLWGLLGQGADLHRSLCARWRDLDCEQRETLQRFADLMADGCAGELLDDFPAGRTSGAPLSGLPDDPRGTLDWEMPAYEDSTFWWPDISDLFHTPWTRSMHTGWWIFSGDESSRASARSFANMSDTNNYPETITWREVALGWR